MVASRTTEFPIITKLGGSARALKILGLTRRAVNHWYKADRRRVAAKSALELQKAAEALGIQYCLQDFYLDPIDWDDVRRSVRKVNGK